MISRRAFTLGLASLLGGCATHHQSGPATGLPATTKGYRPPPDSDEAGLWLAVDKVEQTQKRSPSRIRDQAANALVQDIICRLAGDRCPELRPYLVRVPEFNATCSPNGMVSVWSGLLLRCKDESQLAGVLGHEIAHYLRRHSLQRMRDKREWDDMMAFMQFTLQGPLAKTMWDISSDVRMASISMFSRDHERESDEMGLVMMADAGYDPFACAETWRQLIDEDKAGDVKHDFNFFLSTHPATKERIETLQQLAEQRGRPKTSPPNRLDQAIRHLRRGFMEDEINQGRFKRTEKLLGRLAADGNDPAGALYYRGELYRRRNKDGDEAVALGFYHESCEAADPPAEAFRGVGLIRWRRGETDLAREYFRRYLDRAPQAGDSDMIRKYLSGA
ncbi:putative Peptidase M48 Ste24p [Magnetospirillum sp. LM-5]|uniref:M48 family metallopeptidase n=1 Tax=Magnetospirillum sp. LM-5 TaxID=2681466 RepID=UPI001381475A|nr:M48 family metallopeptidase [Magnetospirillum sp. LM-5]CAA7625860.1 putative Peptidase M48 Ste24p [Magnetospirillum sp. LM-5]